MMHESIQNPSSFLKEELLIREIILTHDPDDHHLDSELLLHLVDGAFHPSTENVLEDQFDAISTHDIDLTGSEDSISVIIYKISNQILSQCFEDENLHKKTLLMLEMLEHYRWDAKVVISLASFAYSFTIFQLISQLQLDNKLAAALATIKRLPRAIALLQQQPRFKAMGLLINSMLKVSKFIISFEGMSRQHELVDATVLSITKSKVYLATYWIFRGILLCFLEIADLKSFNLDEYSDKAVIAAWGLHTVGSKLNSLCSDLGEHVDMCQQQMDVRFYEKLLNMFKESQVDNQEVLGTLFGSHSEFPLKHSSSGDKCGVLELKNKVVILLITKPDLMPLDKIVLLVQKIHDHRQRAKLESSYAVLWVPIPSLHKWSHDDKTSFEFFSNHLPWFSIRRPWSMNSTVVNYIKQEWNFKDEPVMVVLNENGSVSNKNAMDMVWIWGLKAFPFSTSREKEMFKEENWVQNVMIPFGLVEEGKDLILYGSNDVAWIREFSAAMKRIKRSGIEVEAVYVGCKNPDENVKTIVDSMNQDRGLTSLTFRKMELFWFQLERVKRSMEAEECKKLRGLVESETWALISGGSGSSRDVVYVDAEKVKEWGVWEKNVGKMGLVGAVKGGHQLQFHTQLIPFEEGVAEKELVCGLCKRAMDKCVLFKCEG